MGIGCCVGILCILFLWGMIFPDKGTNLNSTELEYPNGVFENKYMSFHVPPGWQVHKFSDESVKVYLDKDHWVWPFRCSKKDYEDELVNPEIVGPTKIGTFTDNISGIKYHKYIYYDEYEHRSIGYLFIKNGKYFILEGWPEEIVQNTMRAIK